MAVRFSATGQDYTSTSSPPTAPFTVVCWVYLSADRNYYSTLWDASPSTGDYLYPATDADGTTLRLFRSGTAALTGLNMTTATWYRVAVTVDSTGLVPAVLYHGAATGALTVATGTFGTVPTPTTFRVGQSVFGDEHLNGRVAALKHWSAVLTQAEVEAELGQYQPARGANLVRWHPMVRAEATDYSGSGRTLAGGTGTATEDGPPIPWGPSPVLLGAPAVAAAVDGEFAGAALVPTAGVSATVTASGSVAGIAGTPTAALADDVTDPGQFTGAASLPAVAAAGTVAAAGAATATAPGPGASLAGGVTAPSVLTAVAPEAGSVITGAVAGAGGLGASVPLPVVAAVGNVTGGAFTGVAWSPETSAAGTVTAPGALAGGPLVPTGNATGVVTAAGGLAATAPAAVGGFVSNTAGGQLDATTFVPTSTAEGVVTAAGAVAASAPLPSVNAAGSAPGNLTADAPQPATVVTATVTNPGQIITTAPAPAAALTAGVTAAGQVVAAGPVPAAAFDADTAPTGALHAAAPLPAGAVAVVVIAAGSWQPTAPSPRLALAGVPALARGSATPAHRDGPTITPTPRRVPTMTGGGT